MAYFLPPRYACLVHYTIRSKRNDAFAPQNSNLSLGFWQAVSASIVLVLDMSPSVSNQTTTMRAAILSFISGISDRIGSVALKIAILGFDGRKEMIDMLNSTGRAGEPGKPALERQEQYFVLTKANQPKLAEYVGGMKMGPQIVGNDLSTNLHGAVTGGLSLLDKSTSLVNIMVLFTDGKDQAGVVSAEAAITKANASKVKGVLIFGIYLKSTEQSSDLINSVSTPSYSFNIDNINQLVTEFDRFATFIAMVCSNVYVYMYCSPKRAGTTKVQMFLNSAPASLEHAVDTADFDTTTKEGVCTKVFFPQNPQKCVYHMVLLRESRCTTITADSPR